MHSKPSITVHGLAIATCGNLYKLLPLQLCLLPPNSIVFIALPILMLACNVMGLYMQN